MDKRAERLNAIASSCINDRIIFLYRIRQMSDDSVANLNVVIKSIKICQLEIFENLSNLSRLFINSRLHESARDAIQ